MATTINLNLKMKDLEYYTSKYVSSNSMYSYLHLLNIFYVLA